MGCMNTPTWSTQPQEHPHIFRKIFHRRTRPHAPATRRHVPGTLTASTDAVRNIPSVLTDSVNGVRNIPSDLTEYSVSFSGEPPAPLPAPENWKIFKLQYLVRLSPKFDKLGTKLKLRTRGTQLNYFQGLKTTKSHLSKRSNSGQLRIQWSRRPIPSNELLRASLGPHQATYELQIS